jgi:hypothetical protein
MYLCSNWVRTSAARVISVVRPGSGDVLEDGPLLVEQGEPAFSPSQEVAEQCGPGAGTDVEVLAPGGGGTPRRAPRPAPPAPPAASADIPKAAAR